MSWGVPRRPKISNRVENRPINREGSEGDIQIKGTGLGAKLFAKWSGRWWDVPLSIDGVTKFGVTDSNYLSIDRDSVDIYSNSVKVASFGETTTVKDINLTGKITLTSSGDRNICIGTSNVDTGDDNVSIGVSAGYSLNDSSYENVLIGSSAGVNITSGYWNVVIGHLAGGTVASGADLAGEGVIIAGTGKTGYGVNSMLIGSQLHAAAGEIYNTGNSTDFDQTSDVRFKTNISDVQDNALSLINQIRIRNFNWKEDEDLPQVNGKPYHSSDSDKLRIGVIAQELEEALPQCVGQDGHGYKSVNLNDAHFLVIKAVQELSAKLDTMQTEINNLKAE